jgi:glucose-6-phosphate isomerase
MTSTFMPVARGALATAAWHELGRLARERGRQSVAAAFAADPARADALAIEAEGLLLDFSRQRLDRDVLGALLRLADERGLRAAIEAMFRGEIINASERRQALHVALRGARSPVDDSAANPWGAAITRAVLDERARMLAFAAAVRRGDIKSSAGRPFSQVIHIGIGGSDLGPCMAVEALRAYADGPRVEFVSNVDGCDLGDALAGADPATTLFVICSKTFTTQETLANARSARAWLTAALGEAAVREHFAAVSVNAQAMDAFGVHPDYRFALWDWVGGRYSLWSSIGLSIAIAIGVPRFGELLAGGAAMDRHFREAGWERNLPVLMALLGVWNINFLRLPTLAVLPYDARLRRFPAFLQQLEMESNGKRVDLGGDVVDYETAPVVWGEPGSNAQHSFFQLLHQGTPRAALDLLVGAESSCGRAEHQQLAIANCLAQAEAFMRGQQGVPAERIHEGNRPATVLAFRRLDPWTLGQLVALYEHKVFVQSVIWGINAFDQFGVELGKKLCDGLLPLVRGERPLAEAAPSLRRALAFLRRDSSGS